MAIKYLSVCSGIEAATVAWHPLGWEPVAFAEIEPFPCKVLAHHYPTVPNRGDMTKFEDWPDESIDLLVGGTPCQSFSVAGKRAGLDDPRGQLMLAFLGIAERYRPKWLVWENVPGVLSSNRGRDFGTFLGALGELGYGWAFRVLDAQYFGVAQRRRRVFVVGCAGDWRRAAEVLFEPESLRGISAPVFRKNGPEADVLDETRCLGCGVIWTQDGPLEHCPVCGAWPSWAATVCNTLSDGAHMGGGLNGQDATSGRLIVHCGAPRRLTTTECERLQGFPDGYTNIPGAKDGPRYKALGNSMAVPCMAWIGERICS